MKCYIYIAFYHLVIYYNPDYNRAVYKDNAVCWSPCTQLHIFYFFYFRSLDQVLFKYAHLTLFSRGKMMNDFIWSPLLL